MEFSAWPSVTNAWPQLLAEATHIEKAGWKGLWIGDHFMPNQADTSGYWQESWTVLAALAASVPRLRLGTLVTGNTYRNPCILAKQVAQVDVISGGRVTLGIGAGWQENEHVAYGIPYLTPGDRLRRLEESLQVLRSLFDNACTTFHGKHYQVEDAPLSPRPVQDHLPILVGGGGEKVTLRLVAQYADQWNITGPAEVVAQKSEVLREHCERVSRDPASIHHTGAMLVNVEDSETGGGLAKGRGWVSIHRTHDLIDALTPYAEAGVDEMIIHFNPALPLPRRKELLTEFMGQVAPAFA
ncbi:MAG TPA: TIGR03560 family F420-dependent LLM class oxidoreductase [Dehalococcoidia bacterium]|nr:TIGR03560 family F420-dependent LLM class oxidoreductase [Dehalococcoidia bacterium]